MTIVRIIGSPGFPTSEADLGVKVEQAADRSYYPPGAGRHLLAVLASGSRVELLKQIRVPTLVIHGADDPLVPVEGGEDTARHIPGAVLNYVFSRRNCQLRSIMNVKRCLVGTGSLARR
jgi:pimeloyl-ACP methyl ester carboxylesterase